MGFTVERVESSRGSAELAEGWDVLARVAGHPFASHAWIDAWLSAFAADTPLAVYTAWEGDRLAAAIPLSAAAPCWQPRANADSTPRVLAAW